MQPIKTPPAQLKTLGARLVRWAETNARVRCVWLFGSRALMWPTREDSDVDSAVWLFDLPADEYELQSLVRALREMIEPWAVAYRLDFQLADPVEFPTVWSYVQDRSLLLFLRATRNS